MNDNENNLKFENALNELTDRCAEFVLKNSNKDLINIEQFIVKFMLSFDLNFYEGIGILEEAKVVYRDIFLNSNAEDSEEEE